MKKPQIHSGSSRIFKTNKRIRLGVWGLGRGRDFYDACQPLNIDVVAGCDYNADMREIFLKSNPGSRATADMHEFLKYDLDAVLVATYCPAHADDAIACLKAGKHVLSEVTSFHTMAEGVRLVEAVEQSGLVYNLAENYPFSAANMWLKKQWEAGLFGDLMYAEFEYVHELLGLSYTTLFGDPLAPGNQVHSWRSWLHYHYYNTHAFGPMMYITGLRPTRVVALPAEQRLPGTLVKGHNGTWGAAASLINMSNGAVVRNLGGAMPSDTHAQRIWGTLGAAQLGSQGLEVRLGGRGSSPMMKVVPRWEHLEKLAASAGHGGGDFWVLYYFARQILENKPAPFDIYPACDCTIPGILAFRSQNEGGKPYAVPDFRDKSQREPYRNDNYAQVHYDTKKGLFPPTADPAITTTFSLTIRDLINYTATYCQYRDWSRIQNDIESPVKLPALLDALIGKWPRWQETRQKALRIINHAPASDGARVLKELLDMGDDKQTSDPAYLNKLRDEHRSLTRQLARFERARCKTATHRTFSGYIRVWKTAAASVAVPSLRQAVPVSLHDRLAWEPVLACGEWDYAFLPGLTRDDAQLVYAGTRVRVDHKGTWTLCLSMDCPCRAWVDRKRVLDQAKAAYITPDMVKIRVPLGKGIHEIVLALWSGKGRGRFALRFQAEAGSLFPLPQV